MTCVSIDWTFLIVTTIIPVVILMTVLATILVNVLNSRMEIVETLSNIEVRAVRIESKLGIE